MTSSPPIPQTLDQAMEYLVREGFQWPNPDTLDGRYVFAIMPPRPAPFLVLEELGVVKLARLVARCPVFWSICPHCQSRYQEAEEDALLARQPCHRCPQVPGSDEAMWGLHGSPETYFNDRAERLFGRDRLS